MLEEDPEELEESFEFVLLLEASCAVRISNLDFFGGGLPLVPAEEPELESRGFLAPTSDLIFLLVEEELEEVLQTGDFLEPRGFMEPEEEPESDGLPPPTIALL